MPDDPKQAVRDRRMKQVVEALSGVLRDVVPDQAESFELVVVEIRDHLDSIFGDRQPILSSERPAYGVFLRLKSDPARRSRNEIEYLLRSDLDASSQTFRTLLAQAPSFKENILAAINELTEGTD